jgi:Glycosyltransferase family 87
LSYRPIRSHMSRWLERLVVVGVAGYVLLELAELARGQGQNDFRAYYFAAGTWARGGSPYEPAAVWATAGGDRSVPYFLYSPATLPVFAVFRHLSWLEARSLFLILKLLAVSGLVLLWQRMFPEETARTSVFLLTLTFAYDQALLRDLRAGNVSTFEQLFLWVGFWLLIRDRPLAASVSIAVSAFFKQITGVFLALVAQRSRGAAPAILGVCLVLGPQILALVMEPDLYSQFLARPEALLERGPPNPSTLVVALAAADRLGLGSLWAVGLYVLVAVGALSGLLALVTARELHRHPLLLLSAATLAYSLAVPRMKDYSYILLLMPSLYAIRFLARDRRLLRVPVYGILWVTLIPYQAWLTAAGLSISLFFAVWRRPGLRVPSM